MDLDPFTKLSLDVVSVGVKKTNFHILKMLPTDVKKVMEETGLGKIPANNHINELENHGLLKRERNTGKIYPTELTSMLLRAVNKIGRERNQRTLPGVSKTAALADGVGDV